MRDRIKIIRERIEQSNRMTLLFSNINLWILEKQRKTKTSQRISAITERIQTMKVDLIDVNNSMETVEGELKSKIRVLTKQIQKLNKIRHDFLHDLTKYIFPIEEVSASEE